MAAIPNSMPYQGQYQGRGPQNLPPNQGQYGQPQYRQQPPQQPQQPPKRRTLKDFMGEQRTVNRWFVLMVALFGAFCGGLLTVAFMVMALGMKFA